MVAALLDLGADPGVLDKALASLPVHGFTTKISRVIKSGLDVCDFAVMLDHKHENHDHDMEYLHGKEKEAHGHAEHEHSHRHAEYNEQEEPHSHEHRGLPEILDIIDKAEITKKAKELSKRIFGILAKAEARAHGVAVDQVHFHEVGAVDSIVDIVAAAVCLDNLGITEVIVPVLYEGTGFIRCQHGIIPVPVPAVSAIVAEHGLHLHITGTEGEFVTPTRAAIVAALITSDKLPKQFSILRVGIGAGKRNYERPSLLRAMLIRNEEEETNDQNMPLTMQEGNIRVSERQSVCYAESDDIFKLESNIDDCTGEALGYVMERLFFEGARDVYFTPIYMKKNRPAYQLNVLCKEKDIAKLEQIIFEDTTTIGIRRVRMERTILKRKIAMVKTSLGEVQVKVCDMGSGKRYYPEYSNILEICVKKHMAYQDVYQIIMRECKEGKAE